MAGIQDLYTQNPGTVSASAPTISVPTSELGKASTASASSATATGYKAQERQVGENEYSSTQLNRITAQDSPLMKRARQTGMMTAAKRGLQNSSIAAGAAQGEMVDRATPLAQQDATQLFSQGRANQDSVNRANEVSTGRLTDVSIANMQSANQLAGINAQLGTSVSMNNANLQADVRRSNALMAHEASLADAAAQNSMRQTVLQQNSEINRQYLAGTQAMDLATIQGEYQQVLQTSQSAAAMYSSFMDSVAQIQANNNLDPARIAQAVQIQQENLASGLRMIDAISSADLSQFTRSQLPTTPPRSQTFTLPGGQQITIPGFQGAVAQP